MVHPLRNILNRVRWLEREKIERYVITYRHRGAPEDVLRISASKIKDIRKSYFTIFGDLSGSEETIIPFHRILEIRNTPCGRVIWVKKESAIGRRHG